jgi:hypothetical protein
LNISNSTWWVHDPVRNGMILRGDPLPDKPWLQCSATVWPCKRRDEQWTVTLFLLSHHAMRRLAERCGARTPFDLLAAVDELWRGLELAINWDETVNKILAGERGVPMQRPKAIPVAGGKALFEWDCARNGSTLVVTTVLDADMAV